MFYSQICTTHFFSQYSYLCMLPYFSARWMYVVILQGTPTVFTWLRAPMRRYTSRKALFKSGIICCFMVSSLGGVEVWTRGCSRDKFRLTTVNTSGKMGLVTVAHSYGSSCFALNPLCLLSWGCSLHVTLNNMPENSYYFARKVDQFLRSATEEGSINIRYTWRHTIYAI